MANRFQYKITADDDTAKGFASAEKQLGKLAANGKRYNLAGVAAAKKQRDAEWKITKAGLDAEHEAELKDLARTTKEYQDSQKAKKRFQSGMVTSASGAARGISAAAADGSGLTSALGGIVSAGGGVVGLVAAITAGVVKMASGWAEGGAQLGRMSASLGVTTDDLQKFQAVGQQFGISKEDATSAVGGIGQTLHDARYGLNNTALGAMNQLHLGVKKGADGQPDTTAFLYDLADKIAAQRDPYTQKQIADYFGAGAALPMLRQGSGAIRQAGDWAARNGAMRTHDDITRGGDDWRKGVMVGQLGGRAALAAGRDAALLAEPGLNAALKGGEGISDVANRYGPSGIVNAGVAALGGTSHYAAGEVARFAGTLARFTGVLDRTTLGGRLNNPGNIRPVGGGGFAHYDTPEAGLAAMGRQIIRDHDVHGARSIYDLYAGVAGAGGKRSWGYAPASDHNDPAGYARLVAAAAGVDPHAPVFDPHNPRQLAAILSASAMHETRTRISPEQAMPVAIQLTHEFKGLPSWTSVTTHRKGSREVAIGRASVGNREF